MLRLPRLIAAPLLVLMAAAPLPASAQDPAPSTQGGDQPAARPVVPIRLDDPMEFTLLTGQGPLGETVWAQGAGLITAETPMALARFLREHGRPGLILSLNSQGGDLDAGMLMGRVIRGARVETTIGFSVTPAEGGEEPIFTGTRMLCRGACALAYLGGSRRTLHQRAMLGFHYRGLAFADGGPRENADGGMPPRLRTLIESYVEDMGVDTELMQELDRLGVNDDAVLVPHDETVRLRVAEMPSFGERTGGGWYLFRRPDTPGLLRSVRLVDRAERPLRVEILIGCREGGDLEGVIDLFLSDASNEDDERLRTLAVRFGAERLTRPDNERDGWYGLGGLGFAWSLERVGDRLAAATRERAFTLELFGDDGLAGRAELSDGLAEPLRRLTEDCAAYMARTPAPGR